MAKLGKLSKLKSALRNSFRKSSSSSSNNNNSTHPSNPTVDYLDNDESESISALGFQTVYVGKNKRPYQISTQVIKHPSFQALITRSEMDGSDYNDDDDDTTPIMVACEVVLFEHLLWMLQNVDQHTTDQSLHDLVPFYA